jgi:hypothetical protein
MIYREAGKVEGEVESNDAGAEIISVSKEYVFDEIVLCMELQTMCGRIALEDGQLLFV